MNIKKMLTGVLACSLMSMLPVTEVVNTNAVHFVEWGDTNFDGSIDSLDALTILNYVVGNSTDEPVNCDMNEDGVITTDDALKILQYSVGIPIPTRTELEYQSLLETPLTQYVHKNEDVFDYLEFLYDEDVTGSADRYYYRLNWFCGLYMSTEVYDPDNEQDLVIDRIHVTSIYDGYISTGVKMGNTLDELREITGHPDLTAYNNKVYYTEKVEDSNILCVLTLDENLTVNKALLYRCNPENEVVYSKSPLSTFGEIYASENPAAKYYIESGLDFSTEDVYFELTDQTVSALHNNSYPGQYIINNLTGYEYPVFYVNNGSFVFDNATFTVGESLFEYIKKEYEFPAEEDEKLVLDRLISDDYKNPDKNSDNYMIEYIGLMFVDLENDLIAQVRIDRNFNLLEAVITKSYTHGLLYPLS